MKRILFLINTLGIGGAEHVLIDIANEMANRGFHVTVQTIFDCGAYKNSLSDKVQYRKGIYCLPGKLAAVQYRFLCLLSPEILYKLIVKGQHDYEVAFLEGLPTKVISGCSNTKVRKIAWVHTDLFSFYRNEYVFGSQEKNKRCYEVFDKIVCVSKEARAGFVKRMGNHTGLRVQYNPINKLAIFQKALEKPAYTFIQSKSLRLVAVGRLVAVKGFDMLIEAMDRIRKLVAIPVELYIVGGGEEEAKLKELILKLKLTEIVHLCGQQSNPYSIMRQCDAQVVSSRAEGYPLALCEGHLLGLPAIATKCAGPSEIIEESQAGILVDATVEGLADGIVKLVNDECVYAKLKSNAQKWAENYQVDSVYREIESIFR